MRPVTQAGREMDTLIATQILGYEVDRKKKVRYENTALGKRPLRSYSSSMQDAWEVVEAMGITLLPIENGSWFALVGPREGWKSPAEFIECLQKGDFAKAGAAVTESAPLSICLAALNANQKRNNAETQPLSKTAH